MSNKYKSKKSKFKSNKSLSGRIKKTKNNFERKKACRSHLTGKKRQAVMRRTKNFVKVSKSDLNRLKKIAF